MSHETNSQNGPNIPTEDLEALRRSFGLALANTALLAIGGGLAYGTHELGEGFHNHYETAQTASARAQTLESHAHEAHNHHQKAVDNRRAEHLRRYSKAEYTTAYTEAGAAAAGTAGSATVIVRMAKNNKKQRQIDKQVSP